MNATPLTKFDIGQLTQAVKTDYANFTLAPVNDHVVKMSVMTEPYFWHCHPNSDETFIQMEGILLIELETETIELYPGQLVTIPKNIAHKTRPKDGRSVNLTVEHGQIETVRIDVQ